MERIRVLAGSRVGWGGREVRQVREHMALRATHAEPCPPVPTELRAGDPHADDDNSRVE